MALCLGCCFAMTTLEHVLTFDFNQDFSFWLSHFQLNDRPSSIQRQEKLQYRSLSSDEAFSPLYLAAWWYYHKAMNLNAETMGYLTALAIYRAIRLPPPHTQCLSLEKMLDHCYRCGYRIRVDEAVDLSVVCQRIVNRLKHYRLGCKTLGSTN